MDNSPLQPAEHFAALLNCSPRHFAERVAKTPGFPAPLRKRKQVWFADEVIDWLRKHRAEINQVGRPGHRRPGA